MVPQGRIAIFSEQLGCLYLVGGVVLKMPVVLALLIVCNAIGVRHRGCGRNKHQTQNFQEKSPCQKRKPRVLFLDLTCTSVKPDVVETISDLVGAYLGEHKKYDVITGQDLRQMAKLEVEKQKSGCMDNSCLNEIAGAMGRATLFLVK